MVVSAFLYYVWTRASLLIQRSFKSASSFDIMAADITTADVYEDASLIGQDIEKIIDRFGHDAVMDLMPKVIRVLEKLEVVVGEKEKDKLEIAELKLENERLYLDIKREASQRRKLDEVSFDTRLREGAKWAINALAMSCDSSLEDNLFI